jgi:glucose-1-phosphate cytidylyltransferase
VKSELKPENVPVFILAGGLGTRFREQTNSVPKPMIQVAGQPMLWHIMNKYAQHGFREFIVCAGYKSEVIKDYFLNYQAINSDFTIDMKKDEVKFHTRNHEDWKVTVADTGPTSMTGFRVYEATRRFLGNRQTFAVTYGDGLTDVDLSKELVFHLKQQKIGTVLGIHPPARFGEIRETEGTVTTFAEKKPLSTSWISGGFFFFNSEFQNYLSGDENLVLEEEPMRKLVGSEQLSMYKHSGFWACMDTQRDHDMLEELVFSDSAPWLTKEN